MNTEKVIELLKAERECVRRNRDQECDRNCACCDLVQEDHELIEMYDLLIRMINNKIAVENEVKKEELFLNATMPVSRLDCRNCPYAVFTKDAHTRCYTDVYLHCPDAQQEIDEYLQCLDVKPDKPET